MEAQQAPLRPRNRVDEGVWRHWECQALIPALSHEREL